MQQFFYRLAKKPIAYLAYFIIIFGITFFLKKSGKCVNPHLSELARWKIFRGLRTGRLFALQSNRKFFCVLSLHSSHCQVKKAEKPSVQTQSAQKSFMSTY